MDKQKMRDVLKNSLSIKGAVDSAKEIYSNIKQKLELGKSQKNLRDKLMENYPSGSVIGNEKREKRKKEVLKMIKDGKMKQARDFVRNKQKEYNALNEGTTPVKVIR